MVQSELEFRLSVESLYCPASAQQIDGNFIHTMQNETAAAKKSNK